jgi:L-aspartate oxidase
MVSKRPRALVIGSGIAGLSAALRLAATHDTTLVTKSDLTESNTLYAQGGIAAVLPSERYVDSVEAHVLDTLRAGAGLNDYEAVQALCADGPALVQNLIDIGVTFDRDGNGPARGLEAAHSHPRILHAGGDATGAAIENALAAAVRASGCTIVEHAFLSDLQVDSGTVVGAEVISADGRAHIFDADIVLLATGGAGGLYLYSTNPSVTTGDGVAAAWRAGAELADVEFFQFHPTALALPGSFLVSEAVRGEGAVLINAAGERFMTRVHPDAELAPRDVVARAIASEMAAQHGVAVRLDATGLGAPFLAQRFPTIDAATRAAGYDWAREPIPVTPAAHYWMGGVATDVHGRTTLGGLYAIGEVACTGVHGANRLASNSLLEGLVYAERAVRDIERSLGRRVKTERAESSRPVSTRPRAADSTSGTVVDRAQLQQLMWDTAGVVRSRTSLERAADTLASWSPAETSGATIAQREDANLLDLARVLVRAALAREESRGAHYRSDFPESSPDFVRHLRWAQQGALAC